MTKSETTNPSIIVGAFPGFASLILDTMFDFDEDFSMGPLAFCPFANCCNLFIYRMTVNATAANENAMEMVRVDIDTSESELIAA